MARFLSPEWLADLDAAAQAASDRLPGDASVVIQQIVRGVHEGEVAYALRLAGGTARVEAGVADDADVTLVQDHDTALAIARGDTSAQAEFMAGRLEVHGDARALVAHQGTIASLDDALAPVRAATSY